MWDAACELGEQLAESAAHIDAALHGFLTNLRAFEESGEWGRQGFRTCSQWMSWRLGWDVHTSREHIRTAKALATLPQIDDALRTGALSYSKVRAMTRVATPENEETLLEHARFTTASQLVSLCKKYGTVVRDAKDPPCPKRDQERRQVTRRQLDDGMVEIRAVLHAEEAERVWTTLDRIASEQCRAPAAPETVATPTITEAIESASIVETSTQTANPHSQIDADPLAAAYYWSPRTDPNYITVPESLYEDQDIDDTPTFVSIDLRKLPITPQMRASRRAARAKSFDRATALVTLADELAHGRAKSRTPTEIVVTVPIDAVANAGAGLGCLASGASVPAMTIRRLCCDAGLVPMVEHPEGTLLAVGRKTRTISGALKRALLKRDHTCTFPGCTTRVFLEGHHARHWADGGTTALDNLCLICSHHHRFVHEYGYSVELVDGVPQYRAPNGTVMPNVPAPVAYPDLGWPTLKELNAALEITPETIACGYDGTPVSYADLVHALVRADGL